MDDEINLATIIVVFVRWWKLIAAITLLCTLGAYVFSSFMKPVYEAKSRILMRASSSSSSLGQMASLAVLAGVTMSPSGGVSDIQDLIESRKVTDYVSKEAVPLFIGGKHFDLGRMTSKITGNYLDISVKHKDPYAAQLVSNAYVAALSLYWNKLNYSDAQKKIEYIDQELPKKQVELRSAEEKLKSIMYLNNDAQGAVETVEILRAKREVDILNSVYMMLRNQLESAKLDAAKDTSPFSDVELALLPVRPVSPKIGFNTTIGFIMGLFIGVFAALIADSVFPKKKN